MNTLLKFSRHNKFLLQKLPVVLLTATLSATVALPEYAHAASASAKSTAQSSAANEQKQKEAATELARLLKDIDTLQADFRQNTQDSKGHSLESSSGKMVLKRPEKFRWTVVEPFPQEVVSDGRQVSYYDAELEQVTIQYLDLANTATPAMLLSGDAQAMLANFTVTQSASDGNQLFTLLPKKGQDSPFQELSLRFEKSVLVNMILLDSLGSRTNIQFSGVKLNDRVIDQRFTFVIPPGVDVLDQRTRQNRTQIKK